VTPCDPEEQIADAHLRRQFFDRASASAINFFDSSSLTISRCHLNKPHAEHSTQGHGQLFPQRNQYIHSGIIAVKREIAMSQQQVATAISLVTLPPPRFRSRNRLTWKRRLTSALLTTSLIGSVALLPIAMAQGAATRRRVPILPSASPPHYGRVVGMGKPIHLLAIGESSVSGVGVSCSDETVTAVTARALGRHTNQPIVWRSLGLSGATARQAKDRLLPRILPEPIDLLIVAFGVNDATSYRSPAAFTDDLAALVTAVRSRVGNAAVVVAGVAPLDSFPALPWPLRTILGWRSKALQRAIEGLPQRLPNLVVERFAAPLGPDLFADDKFHPNAKAHQLWGEELAALALPLVRA
jgi:lysophospholipase L1-like esterase